MKFKLFFIAISFLISLTSCRDNNPEAEDSLEELEMETETSMEAQYDDVFTTISGNPELSTFTTGMTDVSGTFGDPQAYTLFAPSNTAFSYYYQKQGTDVLGVGDEAVLRYHVVPERLDLDEIRTRIQAGQDSLRIKTAQGEELIATLENGQIQIHGNSGGKASISETMTASNGIVHVITEVLIPRERDVKRELQ